MKRTWTVMLVVCVAVGVVCGQPAKPPAKAAPKPPAAPGGGVILLGEGRGQVTLSWDEFIKITGYDPSRKGAQVLTVPWSQVEELLGMKVEKMGKAATVDLPWQDFKALLVWSLQKKTPESEKPPTDYIVTSSQYKGTLDAAGAIFTLEMKVNVLRKSGWTRVPVLPTTVAVRTTKLPEGVYLNADKTSYELITQKPGELAATLDFAVAVQKSAGVNRLTFQRVLGGSSVVDVGADAKDTDIQIAGSQLTADAKAADGKVRVAAALATGAPVTVSWQRALPKVAPAPPKLYAETRTLAAVAEGLLVCEQNVKLSILHSPVRELKFQVPDKATVLTVTAPNLQDWRVSDAGELSVALSAEVVGSLELRIAFESPGGAAAEAPVIQAIGVERQKGFVGVVAITNVEIGAGTVEGATQIDARRLPADLIGMTNQPILLAFRYTGAKFRIPLTIKRHGEVGVLVTIVDSALLTGMQLNDGRRITRVVYSVRNNRNQFLRLAMPPGAEIWSVSVSGNTVTPAKDEAGNVLLPLVRSASRSSELASFPVEMVYVETPDTPAPDKGTLHVTIPASDVPTMHVMYNFYLPAEGSYTPALFGGGGFSGPMAPVKEFTTLSTGPGPAVVKRDSAQQVQQMQQQVSARVDAQARAAGATPIRVRLPVNGKLFKLEKVLVLPKDKLYFEVAYRGWKPAK